MYRPHPLILAGLPATALGAVPAAAQTMDVQVTVPRQTVAEYHAPYVAMWVEGAGWPARTLQIWYDYDNRENGGKKWLADVRQWWRTSGRTLTLPANGVSGATRPPGAQKISFPAARFAGMTPGQYTLSIEAAREVGGREVVRIPFSWPPKPGQHITVAGKTELGTVTLSFR